MGRPEPCVLFSQTFVHPHLDEYVDEVTFAEPIVITACEFLEQNASSTSSSVALVGATSPPSFALEVFVQCEGEARFRRLCQPFLYSHSSSNMLEVEAVVTNHLVVRGSYRSLSLVVYGNTAEDLGQFNVEFDSDSSLANLVAASEANLEDLPPLLHSRRLKLEESITSLKALSLVLPSINISVQIREFLQLIFRMLSLKNCSDFGYEVMTIVTSTAASFFTNDLASAGFSLQPLNLGGSTDVKEPLLVFSDGKRSLLDICKKHLDAGDILGNFFAECPVEFESDLPTSKELVDMLFQNFQFNKDCSIVGLPHLSQSDNVLLWLSLALIICSGKDSCFYYVNGGGMEQLALLLSKELNSSTVTLMLLGVIEQATRYSVGCEGLLGWWPREDETVPSSISEGYNQLLKLLLQKQRHDIAALATYILHRLRFYEVACRYENAVLSLLGQFSGVENTNIRTSSILVSAKSQLRKLLKLMNMSGWVDDPSPVAGAFRSLMMGPFDGLLAYKSTSKLIASSNCRFLHQEIDAKLLSLLKERGFLPLSVALISSSELRTEIGHAFEAFMDVTSSIEAVMLSLMFCRTGLIFLLQHPDLTSAMIHAFQDGENVNECIPLRYASVLISKGFFCRLREVGANLEMHLRVVSGLDRLLTSTPSSEEFLWVLWELCDLSRSDCGRQALLAFTHFPEAIKILIEALHSAKELEPVTLTSGTPLNLAIFHAAAELCEVIVTDSASTSVSSWIDHATDLHKALHSSSPGSNRKDAPTRLLEWIDAGVVYHKNGAVGLLRYAAVLASGGDAHITSADVLVLDSMDVDNALGYSSNESDVNLVESLLGKLVSEKLFDGVLLRDSAVAQLTTTIRILAHIAENSDIVTSLYDEGAMTIIYVILVNCRLMLERSSNNYDYLVDDGIDCSSTSDLVLERNREKCLVDLLISSLLLLMELLQRLQGAKEQYKNTKLMNVLLQLHREISPKLAACAVDLSLSYPDSALSLETICHLISSALACWPVHSWAPSFFHTLLDSVQAASSLALGPMETCSMLSLLIDLLPEEGIWHWKNGLPLLTAVRSLAIGTCLGSLKERKVNWYLEKPHLEVLLCQLRPHLPRIAELVLHYAVSTLVVIQDMLRIFILRTARQNVENASVLLQPILSWIHDHLIESSSLEEIDTYKGYKLLNFLSCVLEHPLAKPFLLKDGAVPMLIEVLGKIDALRKSATDERIPIGSGYSISNCLLPVLRSLSLLCDTPANAGLQGVYRCQEYLSTEDCAKILYYAFRFCQVLPVGKELLACLAIFSGLVSHAEGRRVLVEAFRRVKFGDSNEAGREEDSHKHYIRLVDAEWKSRPLLFCLINLYRSVENDGLSTYAVEAAAMLTNGAIRFCMEGKSLSGEGIDALKYFFGLSGDVNGIDGVPKENIQYVRDWPSLLSSKMTHYENISTSPLAATVHPLLDSAQSLSSLLLKSIDLESVDDVISEKTLLVSSVPISSKIHLLTDSSSERIESELCMGELGDRFQWECPENLHNRLSQAGLLGKRKISAVDVPSRHGKGESATTDVRGSGLSITTQSSRRDSFRQRKPNTSRPASMHVDEYIARERNDGPSNSNVIAIQRLGSSGGRPPSIHVDEFMARQRDRQNSVAMAGVESASQVKKAAPDNNNNINNAEKSSQSTQLKVDLDDDLQGIEIVFDAEENEPDDKLPFSQADDNPQQSPQHSIVEETESDAKDMDTTLAPNAQSEPSTRMSVSHPVVNLRREPSVSSEKKYFEQPAEIKNNNSVVSGGFDSSLGANTSRFVATAYGRGSPPVDQLPTDMRIVPPNFIPENNKGVGNVAVGGPQNYHEQKHLLNQPPLPPTPPPPTISPARSQGSEPTPASSPFINSHNDMLPPFPTYHGQRDYQSSYGNIATSSSNSRFTLDSRYSRPPHSPGESVRPLPPLPPTQPSFSNNPMATPSRSSASQYSVYGQNNTGTDLSQYAQQSMMPPGFSRPISSPFSVHSNVSVQHSAPQPQMQSGQQLSHLQPLQPPQMPPPPPISHQLRPPVQISHQAEQTGGKSQGHVPILMQPQPQHLGQQSQISQYQGFYKTQQQDQLSHAQQLQQPSHHQVDAAMQQQMDPAMALQQYFSSPEAIQSLLSDRDKLCQLLEQHPKLMQMLQERLGQL
ncbi:protein virilizer homolog [Silene latifolia]|uniref:protein virilizer homolog n=1 Tax=Silene latifolia TaxID=37657 RepID=UPI003D76EC42